MSMRKSILLALALLAVGSCASAQTYYEQRTYVQPYYDNVAPVIVRPAPYYSDVYYPRYYYGYGPSVGGFVDRSAKVGAGMSAKAAKEVFKARF